jgi:hypothetical protein
MVYFNHRLNEKHCIRPPPSVTAPVWTLPARSRWREYANVLAWFTAGVLQFSIGFLQGWLFACNGSP